MATARDSTCCAPPAPPRAKIVAGVRRRAAPAPTAIVELVKSEFPLARLMVRAFDRGHALDLIKAGVDYQIRETFESAMVFGEAALVALGVPQDEAADMIDGVRRRDAERLELQMVDGLMAGRDLTKKNVPTPAPLTPPKREGKPLSEETAVVASGAGKPREDDKR